MLPAALQLKEDGFGAAALYICPASIFFVFCHHRIVIFGAKIEIFPLTSFYARNNCYFCTSLNI